MTTTEQREAAKAYQQDYYISNKALLKARSKAYYAANKEQLLALKKEKTAKQRLCSDCRVDISDRGNRAIRCAGCSAARNDSRRKEREDIRAPRMRLYLKDYYAANRDKCLDVMRKWRLSNPDKAKAAQQNWRARNKDPRIAYSRIRYVEKANELRQKCHEYYVKHRDVLLEKSKAETQELTKGYVAACLRVPVSLLPDSMHETYRQYVLNKRALRELTS